MNAPPNDSLALGDELRVRLRKMRLTLIFFLAFIANLVLAAFGFATPVGLYTLLAFVASLCLLAALMACVGVDERELHHAMHNRAQTTRVRTPLHVEFVPYVGFWLAWWLVSELFRAARILYANNVVLQFGALPLLVLGVTYTQSWPVRQRVADVAVLVLQIAIVTALFFPTHAWAPQHSNTLATVVRVLVYFFAIMLFDYVKPAALDAETCRLLQSDNDALLRRLMRDGHASKNGGGDDDDELNSAGSDENAPLMERGVARAEMQQRRESLVQVLVAHERVAREHSRAYRIAVLNAWILVSPLIVVLVGIFFTTFLFFAGTARAPRPTSVALASEQRRKVRLAPEAAAPAASAPPQRQAAQAARTSANFASYAQSASRATLTPNAARPLRTKAQQAQRQPRAAPKRGQRPPAVAANKGVVTQSFRRLVFD